MKLYKIEYKDASWGDDWGMVVLASDEKSAERIAREASFDFKMAKELQIEEVDINVEQCVLTANVGG